MKNRWFNWWWLWFWCCWWRWKQSWCHHWCWIGGAKYTIQQSKRYILSSYFQRTQADDLKEIFKNQIIHTKAQQSCTTTEYVTVTMDMYYNILLPGFKGEHPGPNYYLLSDNIYGLGIHDSSNNICSVYAWNYFEGRKSVNNIASCLFCWLNDKGYYSQSYNKNHKMSEIDIPVDNCGGQNKNNVMIQFLNIIHKWVFFGTDPLHFYVKSHTHNDGDRAFKILKVLYWNKRVFTFEKFCEILNTINTVGVIQMFHQKFFDLKSFLYDLCKILDTKLSTSIISSR